ncbi:helix-turn-helix domain-containing protein [Desulfoferula mesophila]|uniref:Transcriptional regulator n=1 Tax=Desulfoferula mesophila TaxID=3058419 RepID=A0AAU9EEY3_9BACT|nr:transcriptional regulator [Desulfoferula mesophilus]
MAISVDKVFKEKMKDASFREEYEALEEEFAIARELVKARVEAKLTQAQVARKMGTSQSAVARLESGKVGSISSIKKYARATGKRIQLKLVAG